MKIKELIEILKKREDQDEEVSTLYVNEYWKEDDDEQERINIYS